MTFFCFQNKLSLFFLTFRYQGSVSLMVGVGSEEGGDGLKSVVRQLSAGATDP